MDASIQNLTKMSYACHATIKSWPKMFHMCQEIWGILYVFWTLRHKLYIVWSWRVSTEFPPQKNQYVFGFWLLDCSCMLCFSLHEVSKPSLLEQPLFNFFTVEVHNTPLIHLLSADKPSPGDLQYFLEFQIPRQWAPMFYDLPLRHQRKKCSSPSLQFGFMFPKLHVSCAQVLTSN